VVRPRRVVRFARLMQRRGRALGQAFGGAAFGGNLKLPWRPRRVIWRFTAASTLRIPASRKPRWRLVAMPPLAAG
jgi:hypothetical protein